MDTGDLDALGRELAAAKTELASLRLLAVAQRWGAERKYRLDQPRNPAGMGRVSGRWVSQGGGHGLGSSGHAGAAGTAARAAARATMAHPEAAAAAARAGGLPLAAGAVGLSRAAGLYDHYATGAAITPILHLPAPSPVPDPGPPPLTMSTGGGRKRQSVDEFDDECDAQYEKDKVYCQMTSAMYGSGFHAARGRQIYTKCMKATKERYFECLQGGVSAIRTPRYDGR